MKVDASLDYLRATMFIAILFASACGESSSSDNTGNIPSAQAAVPQKADGTTSLNGAGATFPYPIYAKWAHIFHKVTGVELNYQSIGSGGGIAQIKAHTVDFGASDAPLEKKELDEEGLVQFPMVIGGVVPVVNLEGLDGEALKFTQTVLADVFLGRIKKWNNPAIVKLNPKLTLPDREIVVVHRADGSGTTWIFTNYLNKVSPEWREKVGTGKAVKWPVGMGGKGNEGVASYVQRVNGAIGYVEFAYALQNKMAHISLQNRDGAFVAPTIESFQAAAANADWESASAFHLVLTDQPGEGSWPITGASFILIHKAQEDRVKAEALLDFFDFCYRKGDKDAEALHYVPMPENVISMIHEVWKRDVRFEGKPLWK